jgi:hypothetical protein
MWNAPAVGMGVVIAADGMLYVYGQNGTMYLVKPNPRSPVANHYLPGHERALGPSDGANGRLYIRHGDVLLAYDIKADGCPAAEFLARRDTSELRGTFFVRIN